MLLSLLLCVFVLQICGRDASSEPTIPTSLKDQKRGSGSSAIVKVPGWPDLTGKFPLSFGIKTDTMVYASGMQGSDMKTMKLVPGGAGPETKQTLLNLKTLLEAAGSSLADVVQCSVSLVNISRDFKAMNNAYASFWPKDPPANDLPALSVVQVAALAGAASVEIQCDAAMIGQGRKVVDVPGFPDFAAKGFPLSFATTANGMVYASGMLGMDMTSGKLVAGGVGAQTTQALRNLEQVLNAAGSSPDRVVGCSISLRSIQDFTDMNTAYKNFWPARSAMGGLPTRVCVQVAGLAGNADVEIQCSATSSSLPVAKAPKVVKVSGWPDMPNFPFSAVVIADGMAYISGNQGADMKTGKLVAGGIYNETHQTLKNLKEAVEAAGASLADVTSCEVSLQDMTHFAEMNRAYQTFWEKDPPSRVAVQVAALARAASVEIRCAAALPPPKMAIVV